MQTPHLDSLLAVMRQLRDPSSGCPWDVKQTMPSLVRYTLEEAYEVAEAIERGEPLAICQELGDLLFQVVFYAQIAQEQGMFDFDDVARAITEKLIRRHPHVFEKRDSRQLSEQELAQQWERIKREEKNTQQTTSYHSIFETLKQGVPAFKRAYLLQRACADVGFDWDNPQAVLDKVEEEIQELRVEIKQPDNALKIEEEFGDLLFALVNVARHLGIEPEDALRKANLKFEKRFRWIETALASRGELPEQLDITSLEEMWKQAKKNAE